MTCSIVCDAKQTSSTNNLNLTNVLAVVCTAMDKGNNGSNGLAKSFNTNSSSDIIKEKNPQNVREIHEKAQTESKSNSSGSMASNSSGTKQGKLQVQCSPYGTIRGNLEKWVDTKDNKTKTPVTEETYFGLITDAFGKSRSVKEEIFNDVLVKSSKYAKKLSFIRNMTHLYDLVVAGNSTFKWTLLGRIPIETIETRGDGIESCVVAKAINCFVTDWNRAKGEGAEKEEWQMRAIRTMILNIRYPESRKLATFPTVDHSNSVVDSVGKQAEELLDKLLKEDDIGVIDLGVKGKEHWNLEDWYKWAEFENQIVEENNLVDEEVSGWIESCSSSVTDLEDETDRKPEPSPTTPAAVESNDSPMKKLSRNQRRKEAGKERRRRPQPITLDKADSVASPPGDLSRKQRSKLRYVPLQF